jgi:hypothetical protein
VKIPGAERAIVDAAKVRDYLLSPEHRLGSAKARFFAQLGFERRNWTVLQDELYRFAAKEAQLGGATRFGQKYRGCRVRYRDLRGVWGVSWLYGSFSMGRTFHASSQRIPERSHDSALP